MSKIREKHKIIIESIKSLDEVNKIKLITLFSQMDEINSKLMEGDDLKNFDAPENLLNIVKDIVYLNNFELKSFNELFVAEFGGKVSQEDDVDVKKETKLEKAIIIKNHNEISLMEKIKLANSVTKNLGINVTATGLTQSFTNADNKQDFIFKSSDLEKLKNFYEDITKLLPKKINDIMYL